jgi:predicted metal-dependent HD superfamily phosphohydrolase
MAVDFKETILKLVKPYYDEPHRFYHTMKHIDAMLKGYVELFGQMSLAEYLAIMYHDVLYFANSKTNEFDSVNMMFLHQKLFYPHIDENILFTAKDFIMATCHNVEPTIFAERIVDLDLMILGRPPKIYDEYVKNTRKEYSWYSNDAWASGREAFLEGMLTKPRIFNTDVAFDLFEQQARKNMERELASLQ